MGCTQGHNDRIAPQHPALGRQREPPLIAALPVNLHNVARAGNGSHCSAADQVFLVPIALDSLHLTGGKLLLHNVDGSTELGVAPVGRLDVHVQIHHDRTDRVPQGREHTDLSAKRRVPEVGDGGQTLGNRRLVPGDTGEPGAPRHRRAPACVELGILKAQPEASKIAEPFLVELLDVAESNPARSHPVGKHHRIRTDVMPALQLVLDLAEILVVVADRPGESHGETARSAERLKKREVLSDGVAEGVPIVKAQRALRFGDIHRRGRAFLLRARAGR